MRKLLAPLLAATLFVAVSLLSGCATGNDAVAQNGEFQFVTPGGQKTIFYDPPEKRGKIKEISGEDLLDPAKKVKLSDYAGKVVVLNIWGSWCAPCRTEFAELQQVEAETASAGVQLLGLDVRDFTRSDAQDFIRGRSVTYPSIYDPPARTLLALHGFPPNVVPSTFLLDKQHRVAAVFLTAVTAKDLLPVVRSLAAEK
ncbi:TlpA family protein disulfide reductase [Pseudonocardiaceae bacterium YIM PH 21723]|nr:TlpA family protein disulfide reductase [Pseudonocardiaceae bacterium YIM PH 21723]